MVPFPSPQAELQELIHTCEGKFKEHDVAGTSRLPRDAFLRCLKSPQRMTRQMANMVASRMRPSPDDGLTSVVSFRGVMAAVHKDAIKRSVLEQMPNSALEKHLLQMFKDDELAMHGGDETVGWRAVFACPSSVWRRVHIWGSR